MIPTNRLPLQGELIQVKSFGDWLHDSAEFISFYKGQAVVYWGGDVFGLYSEWRFPKTIEVRLPDGITYIVQEIDGRKVLIPKS